MLRPTWNTLIASASILSLAMLVLTPSSAFACCRGFGIGFGIGALTGMAISSQPQPAPVYVERRPVPVAQGPIVHSKKVEKVESEKEFDRHHHKTHVADKEPVTRTVRQQPHQPTNDAKPDSKDANLRQCLVKEYLPDNSVVFKDTCAQEQASTAKPVMNEPPRVTQSIQLEPAPAVAQDEVPQPRRMDGP